MVGLLTFGFTPLTQHSLFISLRGPILQAKNAATLFNQESVYLLWDCSFPGFFFFLFSFVDLKVLCLGWLISLRLKKKIYIAFRKIIPGVYYGTVSSCFLPCDVEAALLQFLDAPYPDPVPTMAIIYISSYWILYVIKPLVLASCSLPSIKQNEKSNP